jgi:hypothetical protein
MILFVRVTGGNSAAARAGAKLSSDFYSQYPFASFDLCRVSSQVATCIKRHAVQPHIFATRYGFQELLRINAPSGKSCCKI